MKKIIFLLIGLVALIAAPMVAAPQTGEPPGIHVYDMPSVEDLAPVFVFKNLCHDGPYWVPMVMGYSMPPIALGLSRTIDPERGWNKRLC